MCMTCTSRGFIVLTAQLHEERPGFLKLLFRITDLNEAAVAADAIRGLRQGKFT
jgi:hypothetical protein